MGIRDNTKMKSIAKTFLRPLCPLFHAESPIQQQNSMKRE